MTAHDSRTVSRRRLLRTTAAASVAAGALGGAGTVAADDEAGEDEEYPYRFDTVVNMVEAGADPTGGESVTPLVHEYADDNTLLYFPAGRYKLEQYRNYDPDAEDVFDPSLYRRYENFGLLGDGTGESYFVPPQGQGSSGGYFDRIWFEIRYGRNVYVEGFTLDYTAENTGGRFQLVPTGDFVMRDVRVEGVNDVQDGPFLFWVLDEDAHGLAQNVRAPDGGDQQMYGAVGMYVSALTRGTITLRDCVVVGFPDNGLYASNPSAPAAVHVEGGYYANNNISQVRLGTPDSYVKNARVEVSERKEMGDGIVNMRGVRQANGSGVTVKNCDIVMTADAASSAGIVTAQSTGDLYVENTRIHTAAPFEAPAVRAKTNDGTGYSGGVHAKNVSITGDAGGNQAVVITDRESNSFRNVCVDQPGAGRDGIVLDDSDAQVRNAVIDVDGDPIVTRGDSQVSTSNVRYEGSCPAPEPYEADAGDEERGD